MRVPDEAEETEARSGKSTLKGIPLGGRLLGRDYTEADIAWLEEQDLTEPTVVTALQSAYEQNDPAERGFVGFRASALGHSVGSEAELRQRLAEADERLKEDPKHYDTRVKRLMARMGLALHADAQAFRAARCAPGGASPRQPQP